MRRHQQQRVADRYPHVLGQVGADDQVKTAGFETVKRATHHLLRQLRHLAFVGRVNTANFHAFQNIATSQHATGRHKGRGAFYFRILLRFPGQLLPVIGDRDRIFIRHNQLDMRQYR